MKQKNHDEDNDNWAVDCSEEAVKARQLDLTDGVKGLTMNDDLEKTEKVRKLKLVYLNCCKSRLIS